MELETFYNTTVSVKRLLKDNGESPEDTEEYRDHLEKVHCLIYPLDESFGQDLDGSYGKDFIMITGMQDIIEKDKVIDQDGTEYIVGGVRAYSFMGTNLMEIRIRQTPTAEI